MFSCLNMGHSGQISRTLDMVFETTTHPLLPIFAAPGQLFVAENNISLHVICKQYFPSIEPVISTSRSRFLKKGLHELGHPYRIISLDCKLEMDLIVKDRRFGGAYVHLPSIAMDYDFVKPNAATETIGSINALVVQTDGQDRVNHGENAT